MVVADDDVAAALNVAESCLIFRMSSSASLFVCVFINVLKSGIAFPAGTLSFRSISSGTMRVYKNCGVVRGTSVVTIVSVTPISTSAMTVVGRLSTVVTSSVAGFLANFNKLLCFNALSSNVLVSFGTDAIGIDVVAVVAGRLVRLDVIIVVVAIVLDAVERGVVDVAIVVVFGALIVVAATVLLTLFAEILF